MKDSLRAVWRWVKWPVLTLGFLYAVLVGWRVYFLLEEDETKAAVAAIHAQKITMADVTGDTAIRMPIDELENDSTVAGVDTNENGIRDDVELKIFHTYSNPKDRAAALQYAKAEQMYLTKVYNQETWKAVAEEDSRAHLCLMQTKVDRKIIENLVFNTQLRKQVRTQAFEFITSHGPARGEACDISL